VPREAPATAVVLKEAWGMRRSCRWERKARGEQRAEGSDGARFNLSELRKALGVHLRRRYIGLVSIISQSTVIKSLAHPWRGKQHGFASSHRVRYASRCYMRGRGQSAIIGLTSIWISAQCSIPVCFFISCNNSGGTETDKGVEVWSVQVCGLESSRIIRC
jgi:hypothetical protein